MTKDVTIIFRIKIIAQWLLLIAILALCAWLIWCSRLGWLMIWVLIGGEL